MKRLIMILLSLTMVFSLVACRDKQETAEQAVNNALTAVQKLDIITMAKYIDLDKIKDQQLPGDFDIDISDIDKEDIEKVKLLVKTFDFEIIDSNEKENSAIVKVKMTNLDMREIFKEYIMYALGLVFTESDENIIEEKLEAKFVELLDTTDLKLASQEVDIALNKIEGNWKLDLNQTALDAILGGLMDIANKFDY